MTVTAPGNAAAASLPAAAALVAAGGLLSGESASLWPIVTALLIAPVLEETVFRAGLHDGLLHNGAAPWLASLLTALAFSAAHMLLLGVNPQTALVWLPALLIGAAYNHWRRLRICIALHMAMNALWIAVHGMS